MEPTGVVISTGVGELREQAGEEGLLRGSRPRFRAWTGPPLPPQTPDGWYSEQLLGVEEAHCL